MWNTFMTSGCGGLPGALMGTSIVSTHRSKLRINKKSIGETMNSLAGGE